MTSPHDNTSIPADGKHVLSRAPGAGPRNLDLGAARAMTNTEAAGGRSDMDSDEGYNPPIWDNDGSQG